MFGQRVGIATCLNIKEVVVAVAVRLLAGDSQDRTPSGRYYISFEVRL